MKFSVSQLARAFGKVLQRLRLVRGESQEDLAKKSHLNRTFISFLERGLRQPTLSTIARIAGAFRLKPSTVVAKVEQELPLK